jgi:hypothetical protein
MTTGQRRPRAASISQTSLRRLSMSVSVDRLNSFDPGLKPVKQARLAGEIFEEILVGIVDAAAGGVESHRVVLADRVNHRGVDDLELGVDRFS